MANLVVVVHVRSILLEIRLSSFSVISFVLRSYISMGTNAVSYSVQILEMKRGLKSDFIYRDIHVDQKTRINTFGQNIHPRICPATPIKH